MFNVQREIRGQFPISSLIYIEVIRVQRSGWNGLKADSFGRAVGAYARVVKTLLVVLCTQGPGTA
jgi:hypothetical protein